MRVTLLLYLIFICHLLSMQSVDGQHTLNPELAMLKQPEPVFKEQFKKRSKLLNFYSRFFSSQDGNTCTFSPSCSRYANIIVHKKGLFTGILATADRLCRCNPFNRQWYIWNNETGYHEDDVN